MTLRLDSVIKPFSGGEGWTEWFERFSTVANHQKWEEESSKAGYLLLFMEGTALKITQQMPEADRKSCDKISKRMVEAFSPNPMVAHERLVARRLKKEESVESLYYDLVSLWRASTGLGQDVDEKVQYKCILPFFLAALPTAVATQLRIREVDSIIVDRLLAATRLLISPEVFNGTPEVVGAAVPRESAKKGQRSGRCGKCGDKSPKHVCPFNEPVCFSCKQPGHRSADCANRKMVPPKPKNLAANKPWSGLLGEGK